MRKLRFKIRNSKRGDILYYGIGDKFISSGKIDSKVNRNIIIGLFNNGKLDEKLGIKSIDIVPTVTELLKEVMTSKYKTLKHKTMLAYNITCNSKIIPYFKDMRVNEVKPIDIKRFQDSIVDKGLKKQTIVLTRVLLKEVFSLAIINEWITMNPIKMVDMPKIKSIKKKMKPFTLDEIDLILKSSRLVLRNFLGISFFTGIRSGELLALKWEDIDFSTDTISINKTIASGVINSPKTASSERDIEMLPKVKEFLKSQQLETGLKNTFVFLTRSNSYYSNNSFFYIGYQSVLKKLNIEKRALHNTRHTFASIMLNNKIDSHWVSNTLGHDNLDITLKVYAHYMPKKDKMSIKFLEKRYKNGTHIE